MKESKCRLINRDGGFALPVVWAATAIILILALFVFKVIYKACDDYDVAGIIGGAYGEGRIRYIVPFISTVLTYPLAKISELTGQFYTYYIFLFTALSMVFLVQHYIFHRFKANALCQIALILIQIGVLLNFTFTVIAFLLLGTGLVWAYSIDEHKRNSVFEYICAVIMTIMGIALRRNSIYIVIAFIPLLIETLFFKKRGMLLISIILAVISYVAFKKVDMMVFSQSEITEYYYKYNLRRAFFLDHPKFKYEQYAEYFQKAGITEGMHKALYSALLYDKVNFGYENLNKVASLFNVFEIYMHNPKSILFEFIDCIINNIPIRMYFLAGTCMLIIKLKNLKKVFYKIECTAVYLFPYVLFTMLILRRRVVDRVALPMAIIGILLIIVCGGNGKLRKWPIRRIKKVGEWIKNKKPVKMAVKRLKSINPKAKKIAYAVLAAVILITVAASDILYILDDIDIRDTTARMDSVIDAYDYINAHKENLYLNLSTTDNDMSFEGIPAGEFEKRYFADNLLSRRRWMIFSDWYFETINKYNVTDKNNLMYSAAFDDNILLLAEPGSMLTAYADYMRDLFGIEVKLEAVKYFDQNNVIFSVKAAGQSKEEENNYLNS